MHDLERRDHTSFALHGHTIPFREMIYTGPSLIGTLARGEVPADGVLAQRGWWRRPERLLYRPVHVTQGRRPRVSGSDWSLRFEPV